MYVYGCEKIFENEILINFILKFAHKNWFYQGPPYYLFIRGTGAWGAPTWEETPKRSLSRSSR